MMQSRFLPYWATVVIALASAAILTAMGRTFISASGAVWPWYGGLGTSESNMHLTDWYTPSHVIHGILFFAVLWLVARRLSVGWRLALATLIEAAWEVLENTNAVIERYRNTTVSSDYIGDSVVNSTADIAAMWLGFAMALRLPIWVNLVAVIGFELWTTLVIRDGLALNVLMLLAPSEAILEWQAGG